MMGRFLLRLVPCDSGHDLRRSDSRYEVRAAGWAVAAGVREMSFGSETAASCGWCAA